jgi:hypothetical protein
MKTKVNIDLSFILDTSEEEILKIIIDKIKKDLENQFKTEISSNILTYKLEDKKEQMERILATVRSINYII